MIGGTLCGIPEAGILQKKDMENPFAKKTEKKMEPIELPEAGEFELERHPVVEKKGASPTFEQKEAGDLKKAEAKLEQLNTEKENYARSYAAAHGGRKDKYVEGQEFFLKERGHEIEALRRRIEELKLPHLSPEALEEVENAPVDLTEESLAPLEEEDRHAA
jgi:hypothetical protein